ncbi:MAG TPA: RIP metalloprotease RseP [Candidatus Acidoferrum sp.]|jgi:regulator of sigma E protease|nr:RIP metalloprotease RseP [Candidatus Acidoferrum sp.]
MNIAIGFILVLGILVLVHEWGHFVVARFFGVRVDVFSIGFGPRLFGWKRGATDYRVSAVPLGGYVRMAGQDLSDIDSNDQKPTGAPDELMSKKRWQRALISLAGPVVNLIFPLVLLTGYFLVKGDPYPKYFDNPLVILSLPKDSPLARAGVENGDRIISLNSQSSPTWSTVESELSEGPAAKRFQVTFQHGGEVRSVEVTTAGMQNPDLLFGYAPNRPIVGYVERGKPAYRAGIRRDDTIVGLNGKPLNNWPEMVDAIQHAGGKPIQATVHRNSETLTFTLTPVFDKNGRGETAWVIGISPGQEYSFRKVGLSQAMVSAGDFTVKGTWQVVTVVGKLLTGKMAAKQLQSVIGIASEAGHAVQEGTFAVVSLMAALSLNLGILNLLPIPILDGGNILLLSLEGIRRRDFSLSFKERFVQVGLVFLLVLFVYVMYNDVVRLLPLHS